MSRRGVRIAVGLVAVVALLFAGRWTATLLADRWWALRIAPGAAALVTHWHLLQLALDAAGVALSALWFTGHLLLVYRAIGSVQLPGNVGELELRESVRPRVLLGAAVALGLVLGLLVGTGVSGAWDTVALAWQGVRTGVTDPLLDHDVGLYLAQLPLWRDAHAFALMLVLLGLATALTLYVVIGAVRWNAGRPAINDHARGHLGGLLAALAVVLAWGYLLEPYELVAGLDGALDPRRFRTTAVVAPALAGTALMVAAVSALWAVRPRHTIVLSGWIVLAIASGIGHYVLPALTSQGGAATDADTMRRLESLAYGLSSLQERRASGPPDSALTPPARPALWPAELARALAADLGDTLLVADRSPVPVGPSVRPAWLLGRRSDDGGMVFAALADDRVGPGGGPLFYQPADTTAFPTARRFAEVAARGARPGAPRVDVARGALGVPAGPWPRRLVLAWALQSTRLLRQVGPEARVAWRLDPRERLGRLAPFARWGDAVPRVVRDRVVWLSHGYLSSPGFPLSSRMHVEGEPVGALRAAFLGVVDGASGDVAIYQRVEDDAWAGAWTALAGGVIRPRAELPPELARAEPYPARLFELQQRLLERWPWDAGDLLPSGRGSPPDSAPGLLWRGDSAGRVLTAAYSRGTGGRADALLLGEADRGAPRLRLLRMDSAAAGPAPSVLESQWSRFPLYQQLQDSVETDGGRLVTAPVRFWIDGGTTGAYQATFARSPGGRPALIWISLAVGDRLGAGRTLAEAWDNLRGRAAPVPPGLAQRTILEEARAWMRQADSALRTGDWSRFGRAFDALRELLRSETDSAPR